MTSLGSGIVRYEDNDISITYNGAWVSETGAANFSGHNYHRVSGTPAHCDISFTASVISVRADSYYNHYRFFCYVVDMPDEAWAWFNQSVGTPASAVVFNKTLCKVSGLPSGTHTLRMGMVAGDATILDLDYYDVDTAAIPGTKPVWSSSFFVTSPPPGFSNTSVMTSSSNNFPTSSPTTSSSSSIPTKTGSTQSKSSGGKMTPAIGVGIGVGVAALLVCALIFIYCLRIRKKSHSTISPPPTDSGKDLIGFGQQPPAMASMESISRMSTSGISSRAVPVLHTSMAYESRPGGVSTDPSPTTPASESMLPQLTIFEDTDGLGSTVAYASTVSNNQYAPRRARGLESPSTFTPRF